MRRSLTPGTGDRLRAVAFGWLMVALSATVLTNARASERSDRAQRGRRVTRAAVTVAELRCEYLENPLGLDARQPRLAWKLLPTDRQARGQHQSAYQVLVASQESRLEPGQADLWDSGQVPSSQSVQIAYQGQPLRSGLWCYWKVRVRDQNGIWSGWSLPARWTMGWLEPADWTAQWIGADEVFVRKPGWPPPDNTLADPWLRQTFELPAAPARAVIAVASIGYHELYVNGKKVGDAVLSPCTTDHNRRARYVTYDLNPYLQPGKNTLGLWLGTAWSIFPHYKAPGKPATPIVLAQAELELRDGQKLRWVTDSSWKTQPSPNTLLGVWDFMHYGGELYDARREGPGWADPTLDDSTWKPVTVYQPQVALSAQQVEPNRRVKEIVPVDLTTVSNGVYRLDFGVNFTGWFEMNLAGQPGDKIAFQWSEREKEPMTHRLHSAYILGATGKGTFRNRFNYHVGRWVQVSGLRQPPQISDARGYLVRTDYPRAGRFESSHPLLNAIYQTTLWTFENLSLGGYVVDCAQRERMGYGGDAHATTETGLDNYALGAFYTKWSQDWRDTQGADGNLPYTAPTYWGGGGPGWSGFCVTLPWELHRRYEDTRILEVNFPTIQRWLAFLETKSRNDLLARWGGEWDFLGDWLWPGAEGVNGDTRETLFFNNCYWVYNLLTAARIADALGQRDAAAAWRTRAAQVKNALHREFFRPEAHTYVNGFPAYLAIALLIDLPPAEVRAKVWARLEEEIRVTRQGHFFAGITGGAFLVKTLLEAGRHDLLYQMASQETYPGWGHMLRQGATTFWEDWEGKLSLCHSSYLQLGAWFIEGLGGIRPDPDGGGYRHAWLQPCLLPDARLDWVNTRLESPYGAFECNWRKRAGNLNVAVKVPPNATATLHLPAPNAKAIEESGHPLHLAPGVRKLREQPGVVVLRLEPGHYSFEEKRQAAPEKQRQPSR